MVKLLIKICLDYIKKPCNFETEFDKYWLTMEWLVFCLNCINKYYPTNVFIAAAESLKFIS